MDYTKRCRQISNSFYNLGLEKAQIRDLSGAAECLKKSLHFNKYQTDARNLLGLIYYEMGETAEALVQWVISSNLQPHKNRAVHYLHEIQDKPGRLEAESVNIKKYNQGLFHAQNGSDDLAILQISRVVENNPHFIKAHLVLALLYIAREDYTRAGKSLYKVLQIDKNNPKALWYMSIVKSNTGRAEVERRKLTNAFSHRQMQDDDVIIPPSYKENTGWQSVLNIGAGLLLGAAVIFFLVMPAATKKLNNEHNQEILQYNEQLNQKNEEISSLNNSIETYKSDKDSAEEQLNNFLNSNESVVNQYSILVKILQAYRNNNLTEAVSLYAGFNPALFTDEKDLAIANAVKQDIETNGYQTLEDLAYTMWSAGRLSEALSYYQTCLSIRPDNPKVIFNMAMINRSQGQTDTAVQLFTQVVTQFADSEYADRARSQLAELAPQSEAAGAPGQSMGNQNPSGTEPSQADSGNSGAAGTGTAGTGTAGADTGETQPAADETQAPAGESSAPEESSAAGE